MKSVIDALEEAYLEENIDSFTAILYNLKNGNTSIPLKWVSKILDLSIEKGTQFQLSALRKAIWHFLLLPTSKGAYPFLVFAKRTIKGSGDPYLKDILQNVGGLRTEYNSPLQRIVKEITRADDIKAFVLFLSYANSELAKDIYDLALSCYISDPLRNAMMHHALDNFGKDCLYLCQWHTLKFEEICKEFKNVSPRGLFALLFRHQVPIDCSHVFWIIPGTDSITQLSARSQIFYLKYLYYDSYVPNYMWEDIESCILESDCIEVRLLALEVYAKHHTKEPRRILEFFNACYPYIKDDDVFHFLPMPGDLPVYPSFLESCLYPQVQDCCLAGIIANLATVAFKENLIMNKPTELYNTTLELCDRVNDLGQSDSPTIKELLVSTFREALDLERPNKEYLKHLSEFICRRFYIGQKQRFYMKCVGGDAVAIVSPTHLSSSAVGINGIYGKLDALNTAFEVVGFYGSVNGRKDFVLPMKNYYDLIVKLELGKRIYITNDNIIYFKLEDALRAPLG